LHIGNSAHNAHRIQAALIADYHTNLPEYPRWQELLRTKQPRTLIVWGKGDKIFLPAGAEAYKRDGSVVSPRWRRNRHIAARHASCTAAGPRRHP